jgi:large subunit ribosomal protein L14
MIQLRTMLTPADNSGAKQLLVIHIYGGSKRRFGYLAQEIQAVVEGADPNGTVKDEEKVLVVLVRTRKESRRKDGSYIRFDDNAGVVINKDGSPRGTRIFGPIAREVKEAGYNKIASLATEVL